MSTEKMPLPGVPAKLPRTWLILMRRELSAFFSGPIAYIVIALFLVAAGLLFFPTFFLNNRAQMRNFFSLLPLLFSIFIPALSMRLLAEEKRSGTMETLFTLPVSGLDVVLGKFLAVLVLTLVMLLPTIIYAVSIAFLGALDPGPVVGGYLGALLLAALFCSIGLWASALTENQILAFFVAVVICAALTLVGNFLVLFPAAVVDQLEFISVGVHFENIAKGILDSRDILYFLSLSALFLGLTVRFVDDRREA